MSSEGPSDHEDGQGQQHPHEPLASRPWMPGYGIVCPAEGSGLCPGPRPGERLSSLPHYWTVTVWPDGRPHSMPVWAVWDRQDRCLWFISSLASRKARNVAALHAASSPSRMPRIR
ncbi:pyridoxamine 5'-phosphate oxidase family protein [Candidatus Dormiibacter inghamiae]|uniref:pyridoxamine 5'-phosphate oxidase family protein n=1 Tax=Candidatus Dormiibacter inghamiae TaxID=3127013 RepID=UPI003312FEE5